MSHQSQKRRAFTITEILIVIGIIALLVGLLVPALAGVRNNSRKTKEKNDLRQVGWAWNMYGQSHNDACLPGYLETEAQADWKVTYGFPDETPIPPAPGYSGDNIAGPWTWRLMQYLDFNHDLVHGYEEDIELDQSNFFIEEAFPVALHPAFGYNGYYMGGWYEAPVGGTPSRYRFIGAKDLAGAKVNVVARSIAQIRRPEHMVTFCSSTFTKPTVLLEYPENMTGYHLAVPSTLAEVPQWQGGGASTAVNQLTPGQVEALVQTAVPIGRFTGQAAVLYADGSTFSETAGALMDQSKWINNAREVNGVRAELFTHTEN